MFIFIYLHNYALLLVRETSKLITIYLTKIYLPYLCMNKYSCLTY
nr:MAG TPA_asm: hypothetical protein [Caudoviricetes sp.]